MKYRYMDLVLINILTIFGAVLAQSNSQFIWIRGPIGIFITLVVPGYILSEILFHQSSVTGFERVALIAALSVSFVAVGGLLLFLVVRELSVDTWVIFFETMTIIGTGIIYYRRHEYEKLEGSGEHADGERVLPLDERKSLPSITRWLPFALALAIVVGSIFYAQSIAEVNPRTEVIQMWMIPDKRDPAHAVQVGVITENAIPNSYSILVKHGDSTIKVWTDVQLQSNDRWQTTVSLPISLPGTGPLEADLVNPNSPAKLIRQVTLRP